MADLLFAAASLEPTSSLTTFLSTTHYPFSLRRPASLRFSALNKKHHAATAADSTDFGIISSKEHSDGSVVFRFGDLQETVDEALVEPESTSDVNSADVHDDVGNRTKEEIKSAVRRKQRVKKVKVMPKGKSKEGFNNLRDEAVEKETNAVSTMDVDEYEDQVGAIDSGLAREGDFISVSDEEKVVEDVSSVRESGDDHAELAYRPSSSVLDSEIDVESQHLSFASRGGEENATSKFVSEEDGASDGNADGVFVVLPVESKVEYSNLSKGSMTDTADGFVNEHVTETLCMSDDSSASSFREHNGTGSAAGSRDLATMALSDQLEFQMGGASVERDEVSREGFHLSSAAASLPHPLKAFAGGDDLFFVTENWIGVADGINLWSFQGTSPGQFTRELMENCKKLIFCNSLGLEIDPVEVLRRSLMKTEFTGASTALLAFFGHQVLHVANIGDSGFIVIRDGKVFKKSSPMAHAFSFPIRLQKGDEPSECAEVYKVNLDEGDCIIIGTDGLFDNLHELEIASIVSKSWEDRLTPQEIAELLVARAQEVGESTSARTPYSDDAQAAGYVGYRGGKLDAVTVIVSLVQSTTSEASVMKIGNVDSATERNIFRTDGDPDTSGYTIR